MLVKYVSADTEKSRDPPTTAIPNPIQFQINNASESCKEIDTFLGPGGYACGVMH